MTADKFKLHIWLLAHYDFVKCEMEDSRLQQPALNSHQCSMQMTACMCKPGTVDLDLRTSTIWTWFVEYLMRTKDPVKSPFGKLLPVQHSL